VLLWFLAAATRRCGPFVPVLWAYAIYAVMIFAYYSLKFGAPWFLSRYFAPLAPLLLTALIATGLDLTRAFGRHRDLAMSLASIAALILCAGLLMRLTLPGVRTQGHFQVVDWVEGNVADDVWVAAVQTGTLGYWHDRTVNLDGKVNPDALVALQTEGQVLDYVIRTPKIRYLADWAGVADWARVPGTAFSNHFEVVVQDRASNLGVMRRTDGS